MNKQREVIYAERRRVLEGQPLRDFFIETLRTKVSDAVDNGAPADEHPSEWDLGAILDELALIVPVKEKIAATELEQFDRDAMKERLTEIAVSFYEAKEAEVTPDIMRMIESQYIMLPIIDRLWVDHLYIMDALKAGIGLRGYGQKDPRVEYEKEAYEIFEDLKSNIAEEAIKAVFTVRVELEQPPAEPAQQPVAVGANGATAFEPLPSGELLPQAASRLDPVAAERLLGPAPRAVRARNISAATEPPPRHRRFRVSGGYAATRAPDLCAARRGFRAVCGVIRSPSRAGQSQCGASGRTHSRSAAAGALPQAEPAGARCGARLRLQRARPRDLGPFAQRRHHGGERRFGAAASRRALGSAGYGGDDARRPRREDQPSAVRRRRGGISGGRLAVAGYSGVRSLCGLADRHAEEPDRRARRRDR
jgi:hypothetical protein